MARTREQATHISDYMVPYRRPDPVLVARIVDDYSLDAACERWSSLHRRTIVDIAREGRRLSAQRGVVDTSAMRDCVDCGHPFFSASTRDVVCRICRHESAAVFS